MKISLKWLADFFPKAAAGQDLLTKAPQLRQQLPLAGIEIGATKKLSDGIEGVIVAQIQSFEKHPSADRLNVCKVSDGTKVLQIVCGAPNVKAGVKVALAPVGTLLPGGLKIKEAQIRNVDSFGMLCSEKELGLSEESNGIIHLPESAPVGSPLVKALGLNDQIWEVELTPDRADCLSHLGMSREVGRLIGVKPALPEIETLNPSDSGDVPLLSVEVQAAKACPIYGAQLFEGIQNHHAPDWMRRLLENLGVRSHNAIVDITNYTLMELGHPLHAFDADKITGSKIIVRFAKNGEKLKTLDGVERALHTDDLVIADLEKPLALAGVMGGLDSGVTDKTTRIVLESALFDPAVIRATSQRHKIHSDASHRFERGVDAQNLIRAAGRASLLIKQLGGGRRRGSYIEVKSEKAEKLLHKSSFNFDTRAVKNIVGIEVPNETIIHALQSVGIDAQIKSPNVLRIEVPTHRLDLVREIDLVEEVARLIGFDKIPERYPEQMVATDFITTGLYEKTRQIRHRMLETGLTEMMPYCFISRKEADWVPGVSLTELANPLSADWLYMRPNLFFGLLTVLARHAALGQMQGGFFDTGSAFQKASSSAAAAPVEGPSANPLLQKSTTTRESLHAAWALMGSRLADHWSSDKKSSERKAQVDYFDAKGVAEKVISGLTALEARWGGAQFVALADVDAAEIEKQAPWIPVKLLHPYRSALIVWPGKPPGEIVGYVGELHPAHKGNLLNLPTGLQLGAVVGELRVMPDLLALMKSAKATKTVNVLGHGKIKLSRRLPVVERDFALVFDAGVRAGEIEKSVQQALGARLIDFSILDVFKMSEQKHSIAFRLHLQGETETLSDAEIQALSKSATDALAKKFKAELRA